MDLRNEIISPGPAVARDLRSAMRGQVLLPTDADYMRARQVWNGAVKRYPAVFALCEDTDDVRSAVRTARVHGLPLSVRGGGHDWAGRSLRHNGLVIDLSAMRQVEIDPEARIATVGGGATARDVQAAAALHGLAAVVGNCGDVGITGFTIGGGYGPLGARYGLAADNLLGAEVVLADGRQVIVDGDECPDLFWALRGGGGNFGVITEMQVRLHPVRTLLGGLVLFPWNEAPAVLRGCDELLASAPDELGLSTGIMCGPDGAPVVFLAPVWSGEPADGSPVMARLQHLGTPVFTQVCQMSPLELLGMFDASIVAGRHYAAQTRWLRALTTDVIADLSAAWDNRTSPLSAIILHSFRGAAARIAPAATAFGLRRPHIMAEFVAAWNPDPDDDGSVHRQWTRSASRALADRALPGGYPNMLGPDDHDQIPFAYGGNTQRLLEVKGRFDPDHVFSAQPLPL